MTAWLDTTPEKQSQPRRFSWAGGEPEKGALDYLCDWFHEAGLIKHTANGIEPLDWCEINNWKQATGTDATPFELNVLIDLSRTYLESHYKAKDLHCAPPWLDPDTIDQNALIEKRRRRHAK